MTMWRYTGHFPKSLCVSLLSALLSLSLSHTHKKKLASPTNIGATRATSVVISDGPTDVAFKIGSQIMREKVAIGKTL